MLHVSFILIYYRPLSEPVIVHPGAVVAILRLLPAVLSGASASSASKIGTDGAGRGRACASDGAEEPASDAARPRQTRAKQYLLDLQSHIAELLRSLLRSERNQQCMCDSGEQRVWERTRCR